jgi:hypothetical protein
LGVGLTTPSRKRNKLLPDLKKQQPDGHIKEGALNGEEWRKLLKKVRAHTGLSKQ